MKVTETYLLSPVLRLRRKFITDVYKRFKKFYEKKLMKNAFIIYHFILQRLLHLCAHVWSMASFYRLTAS